MKKTPYEVLGVDRNATEEEIKKAYKEKAKENHPDRGGLHDDMVAITKAYETLGDPQRRKHYDEHGDEDFVTFEKMFSQFVQEVIMGIIERDNDPETLDLMKACIKDTDELIKGMNDHKKQLDKKCNKLEKVLKRLSSKKNRNLIEPIIYGQVEILKYQINDAIEKIEFLGQCKEVLKDYNYSFTERKQKKTDELDDVFQNLEKMLHSHFKR